MQSATFELVVEELDQRFIEALKALFSGKKVKILVTENNQAPAVSLTLADIVAANRQTKTVHQLSEATLDFLLEKMTANDGFDLVKELEAYRVERP